MDVKDLSVSTLQFLCGKFAAVGGTLQCINPVAQRGTLGVAMATAAGLPDSSASWAMPSVGIDTSKWEKIRAVMDSGATVPVLHPKTGREYPVEESEASRAGVEYELADASTLANLGRKRMAVLTNEGTLRGYSTECAEVSKALQSVRACVHSKHAVCFGLGPDGEDHLVINRETGEVNRLIDDGVNYLQELHIIPADQVCALQAVLAQQGQPDPEHPQGFAGQGR